MNQIEQDILDELESLREAGETTSDVLRRIIAHFKKSKSRQKKKKESETCNLWQVWQDAYFARYGIMYPRNAKVNRLLVTLRNRLGAEDAEKVIRFYLQVCDAFVLLKKHDLGLLVKDAETWLVRAVTGQTTLNMKLARAAEQAAITREMIASNDFLTVDYEE